MPRFAQTPVHNPIGPVVCRCEHAIEHFFCGQVREASIEHQPPDDPAAETEGIKPLGRVVVKRLCVFQRVGRRLFRG